MKNLILFLLALIVLGGFYLVLDNLQEIKSKVHDLELGIEILYDKVDSLPETVSPGKAPPSASESIEELSADEDGIAIPTALLFKAESSPLLSPQTLITVAVEKAIRNEEGVITLQFKMFTNEAGSYSALNPANIFELVNLSSTNQKPLKVRGSFDSIPPQSSISGEVIFKVEADNTSPIIQINMEEGIKFYQFDFEKRSYEEAILG